MNVTLERKKNQRTRSSDVKNVIENDDMSRLGLIYCEGVFLTEIQNKQVAVPVAPPMQTPQTLTADDMHTPEYNAEQ